MATIKLFENWLNEQAPTKPVAKPAVKPAEGGSGTQYANADAAGVTGYGNPGVFAKEILANSTKIPFVSKIKPGYIVDVAFPPTLTRDKTEWFFDVNAYRIFPSKNDTAKFYFELWRESYSMQLPETHPSGKNTSTFSTPDFPTFSLEGNPAPTDLFLGKAGAQISVAASDIFKKLDGVGPLRALPDLYAELTDYEGPAKMTPDQFASLVDAAAPGAKASLIAQLPAILASNRTNASYKAIIDWGKTQTPAQG